MIELFILIVLLLAVALILHVDFIVYVAYVLIAIYAISRWVIPRSLKGLHARRLYRKRAFLYETVEIQIALENRSRLPILWLQLIESVPPELRFGPTVNHVIHLGPGGRRLLSYKAKTMKRGYYRLGPMQITSGDLFGFQENHSKLPPDYLTVYPRIIPISRLNLPSRLPFGSLSSRQRLFEDPARPHGVREYRTGDSLRLVNWKVSAHTDSLLVRTHQPAISLETSILLNLNADEYSSRFRKDGPEWAIVLAASLASHLVTQRQSVGLVSNGLDPFLQLGSSDPEPTLYDEASGRLKIILTEDDKAASRSMVHPVAGLISKAIPPKPGREHLMQILERLARLEAAPTVDFARFAFESTHTLSWGVTLMVITPDASVEMCNTFHRLVSSGFNVALFVVEQYIDFPAVKERARLLGFEAYHIADHQALRRWQQETPVPTGVR